MENKRNLKEERGITLLALIITIIILAILALITISSAYMSGIIQFGVNGAKDYAQSAIEENRIMEETGNYVESVTKKIKVLLGEEPPTNPELSGMDWFVKGVTQPAEESKEVAEFYAKNQPDGTLIIYPKNGIEATIEYVEVDFYEEKMNMPPWVDVNLLLGSAGDDILTTKITSVYVAKGIKVSTCQLLFSFLINCTEIDLTNLDTAQVKDMSYMFYGCISLRSIDLTPLDTRQVTDMTEMFGECRTLTHLDLTPLDTSQVTSMGGLFDYCEALQTIDLTSLDTKQVEVMDSMFNGCSNLRSIDLTSFDTNQVTYMGHMFSGCSNLRSIDLTSLETSNVLDMRTMFGGCSSLRSIDLTPLDTQKVEDASYMFDGCSSLETLNLSRFDTSHMKDISYMFQECQKLNTSMTLMTEPSDYAHMFQDCSTEPRFIVYIKLYGWTSGCCSTACSYC